MFDGAAFVPQGMGLFLRRPGLWLYGLAPVAVSAGFVLLMVIGMFYFVDNVTVWATGFADSWPPVLRGVLRVSFALAILASFALLIVVSFAEVTNIIGQPFFEIISDSIEKELGDAPPSDGEWWHTLPRTTFESAVTIAGYLCFVVPLFAASFIPLVGQTVVPVLAALVSGWFLSLEIVQIPLERRGQKLRQRISFHWDPRHRFEVLGFGTAAFLLFMIPLMNVVAMPGAIVGATLLVRRLTADEADA